MLDDLIFLLVPKMSNPPLIKSVEELLSDLSAQSSGKSIEDVGETTSSSFSLEPQERLRVRNTFFELCNMTDLQMNPDRVLCPGDIWFSDFFGDRGSMPGSNW